MGVSEARDAERVEGLGDLAAVLTEGRLLRDGADLLQRGLIPVVRQDLAEHFDGWVDTRLQVARNGGGELGERLQLAQGEGDREIDVAAHDGGQGIEVAGDQVNGFRVLRHSAYRCASG